jgi:hypothetical protein
LEVALNNPEIWAKRAKSRKEMFDKIRALPVEERSSEALLAIVHELMEMNDSLDRLVDATDRVADNT